MTETQMILDALRQAPAKRAKHRVTKEIEPDPMVSEGSDAILKLAKKRSSRPRREKHLSEWTSQDFIKYFAKSLDQMGLSLDQGMSMRDGDWLLRVHDRIVDHFPQVQSNKLLRDYIDWWLGTSARLQRSSIYVGLLAQDRYVEQFVKKYGNPGALLMPQQVPQVKAVDDQPAAVDDETLYEMGGLSMLVMSRGIVHGYRMLISRKESNVLTRISTVLRGFSKDVLISTIKTTIQNGPYAKSDAVDFISVARAALKYHGIKEFDNTDYRNHFKEN